jgi:predicted PurR-regulated permease PerM
VAWIGRAVLGPFIVAAVVAYAFSPLVSTAERRLGWPRPLIVAIGYLIALLALGVGGYLLAGQAVRELELLARGGPDALAATIRQVIGSDTLVIGTQTITATAIALQIQDAISHLVGPSDAIHVARSLGEAVLQSALALIVSFYFLLDGERFRDVVVGLFPIAYRPRTVALLAEIHTVLGRWLRGQLFLIVLVAAVVYVILGPIMGLRYALAIGILTGILEIIPLVGPIVAAGIAAVDAVAQRGLSTAAIVIVIYTVLRQIEDQLVAPVIIGRAVHLHPVVTIFAVLIGLEVYGVLGGLLGVPAAAAINVAFNALYPHGVEEIEKTFEGVDPPAGLRGTNAEHPAAQSVEVAAPDIDGAAASEPANEPTRATD